MPPAPARLLLPAVWIFVFLSASLAEALGLARLRVLLFSALIGGLVALALACGLRAGLRARLFALLLTALWYAMFVLHPANPFDPLDHKILLVLLVLLCAPELGRLFAAEAVAWTVLAVLTFYVFGSFLVLATGDPSLFARGYGAITRVDVSGSMVVHASLCALFLPLAARACVMRIPLALRAVLLVALALALVMLFLVATRTALLTLLLYGLFELLAGPWRQRLVRLLPAAAAGLAVFTLFTLTVSDVLWRRLVGAGVVDYTSGRVESLRHWITLAFDHPLGLGLGAVRRIFAEGRPPLDGGRLLEWPHDEFVRFWVEGGLLGLVFALLLVGGLVVRAISTARRTTDPLVRPLALALAADLLAQSLLQNYFNNIYQATAAILTLVSLGGTGYRVAATDGERHGPATAGAATTGVR